MAIGRKARIIATVLGLAALVVGGVAATMAKREPQAGPKAPPPLEFLPNELTTPALRPLSQVLPISGTLEAARQATVRAKVSAQVQRVHVREGDPVRVGQPLAQLDTIELQQRLAQQLGALEAAKAQLALAEKTRLNNQHLLKQHFISQSAFDNAESGYQSALGTLKSAQAQVDLARQALADASVVAPIAGIVAKRNVQAGDKVTVDAPIASIVDLTTLEMTALVATSDIPRVTVGQTVEMQIEGFADRSFEGRVARINPAAEPGSRAIAVTIALANQDSALRAGVFGNGRIRVAPSAPTLTLPIAAIRSEGSDHFVWTLVEGKLARRRVQIGQRDETSGVVQVIQGVTPGVQVLAGKYDNLKEGLAAGVRAASTAAVPAKAGS